MLLPSETHGNPLAPSLPTLPRHLDTLTPAQGQQERSAFGAAHLHPAKCRTGAKTGQIYARGNPCSHAATSAPPGASAAAGPQPLPASKARPCGAARARVVRDFQAVQLTERGCRREQAQPGGRLSETSPTPETSVAAASTPRLGMPDTNLLLKRRFCCSLQNSLGWR